MTLDYFIYSGAGNTFVLIDNRKAAIPAGDFSREETFSGFVNNGVDSGGLDVPFLSGKTIFSEVAETPFSGSCSAGTTVVRVPYCP